MIPIKKIKQLKKELKLTTAVLSKKTGIPIGTLNKIFTGETENPTYQNVQALANAFGCSIEYLIDENVYDKNWVSFDLSDAETGLITKYRLLDEHLKTEARNYIDYLVNKNESRPVAQPAVKLKTMRVYTQSASAGLGNYLIDDDDSFEMLDINETDIPSGAEIGVRIAGDSMEPQIKDGSIVWVETKPSIENGQIGIFILNGEAFCKKLDIDYNKKSVSLLSLNKQYKPIKINEGDELRTVGRVLFARGVAV